MSKKPSIAPALFVGLGILALTHKAKAAQPKPPSYEMGPIKILRQGIRRG